MVRGVSGGISTEQVLIENTASMNGSVIGSTWRRVLIDVEQIIGPQQFSISNFVTVIFILGGRTSWDNIIITYYSGNAGSTSGKFYIDDIKMYGHAIPSCPGQVQCPWALLIISVTIPIVKGVWQQVGVGTVDRRRRVSLEMPLALHQAICAIRGSTMVSQ